jgi:hypothetical protein
MRAPMNRFILINDMPDTNFFVIVQPFIAVNVEPLLCNDREMDGYTRAVSGQRLGKHVPAATDTNATMVQQQRVKGQVHTFNIYVWAYKIHFNIILPQFYMQISIPHACYMPRWSHPRWFYHSNDTWCIVRIMNSGLFLVPRYLGRNTFHFLVHASNY